MLKSEICLEQGSHRLAQLIRQAAERVWRLALADFLAEFVAVRMGAILRGEPIEFLGLPPNSLN